MTRIARVAVLAVTAALALTGCVKYNVDVTVASDNTVSGTVVTAVKEGVAEMAGTSTDQEAYDQLFEGNPFAQGEPFKEVAFDEDGWIGKAYSFSDVPITELTAFDTTFTITRNDDVFELTGPAPGVESAEEFADAETTLTVTFPGKVLESNGEVKGNTVTWNLLTQTEDLEATAKATKESSLPLILIIVGAVVLLLVVAAAIVITLRARKASKELDAQNDEIESVELLPEDGVVLPEPEAPAAPAVAESAAEVAESAAPEAPATPDAPDAPDADQPKS